MKIYNYHPITKEFLSESTADESPLEQGVFLIPANATRIIPPEIGENQTAVFENNEWVIKPDFRGKIYYDKNSKEEVKIKDIGVPAENLTDKIPSIYDIWDGNNWIPDISLIKKEAQELNTQRHLEFQQKIFQVQINRDNNTTLTMYLDCTDNTCFNLERAYNVAEKTGDSPFYDGIGQGSDTRFSINELTQIFTAIQNRLKPSFDKKGQTKLAINLATTKEEVEAILNNLEY